MIEASESAIEAGITDPEALTQGFEIFIERLRRTASSATVLQGVGQKRHGAP